ncbi:MAG: CCA tRNA nucleotidyltransferase, partial [bacterium]|nr:CCA tRNA nucleotidyltransferase [bacterium]
MADKGTKATALWVHKRLVNAGHETLLAGGCVRDMLLGRKCSDYDIATSASPQEVRSIFKRVLMIGAKFGVVMVIHNNRQVEVATFRSDLSYSDGRRPDGVRFTTPRQDALRRDFTINGMFYNPGG